MSDAELDRSSAAEQPLPEQTIYASIVAARAEPRHPVRQPRRHHRRSTSRKRSRRGNDRRVSDHRERRSAARGRRAGAMGAPNLVRGGSHSGNVATAGWRVAGALDVLSSDYVPASLLMGAFELERRIEGLGLAAALATVTLQPARATGLDDRGRISTGLRADLIRIHVAEDLPVVREVYRDGRRVL